MRSSTLPFYTLLITQTGEAKSAFENNPVVLEAVRDGMSAERYRRLLLELYHIVHHFNLISEAAAQRMPAVHGDVRDYLLEHIEEEAGHDQWVLGDLESLGVARDESLAHQPSADVLALTGYNYWCADRRHPVSVLGMLYCLEVLASAYGGQFVEALRERLLLEGEAGVSFLSSHATLDSEHLAELRQALNTVHDPDARAAVIESARMNFQFVSRIIEAI